MIHNILELLEQNALVLILTSIMSYLMGSISFAVIVTMYYKKKDIREYGSGNAGMTNVMRSVGKVEGLITLVGDFLKAVIALKLTELITTSFGIEIYSQRAGQNISPVPESLYIAGFFCLLGHMFPIFFKFKGGKGVLVTAGMIAVIDWRVFIAILIIFVIVFLFSKTISLASIISAVFYPIATYLITFFVYYKGQTYKDYQVEQVTIVTVTAALIAIIIIFTHRQNIVRIFSATEPKFKIKGEKPF